MASFACPACGAIGEAQPCTACGAPAYDLANPTELEALRFSLARRTRLRAGLGAGIGSAIGFIHSEWLQGVDRSFHITVMIAWAFALAAVAVLLRPREIASLEEELAARTGRRTAPARRANLVTLAVSVALIVIDTGLVLYAQASTMPRRDAEKLIVQRTCKLAEKCSKGVFCMGDEFAAELVPTRARVDRDQVDDCLAALDELDRTHTACTAPAPASCAALSRTTIPRLLLEAHQLEHDIDRAIDDQLRKGLEKAPKR